MVLQVDVVLQFAHFELGTEHEVELGNASSSLIL